jgi:type VI secretion system protein ImpK
MGERSEWQGLDTVKLFKEFYSHVYAVKNMIMVGVIDWPQITPDEIKPGISDKEKTRYLASYLKAMLIDQMEYVSANTNSLEFAAYEEACYLMSALTDEIFLIQMQWFGTPYWNEYSIESGVFSSCYAGDEYYRRLDALMNKEVLTSLEKKLAMLFIISSQLGFRGSLRGREKKVVELRNRLLPMTGYSGNLKHIFPSAYAFVRNPVIAQKLEPLSRWNRILFLSIVTYLVISSGLWWWLTHSFSRSLMSL